ncbi:MAG: uroporphyrinogen methyltransferase / synthase [Candidatus Sumerlaeota bacterium]|nr:uroporphyrinogen methyltransferase / synthase [Candidatus Sumerlaeota bacterium]
MPGKVYLVGAGPGDPRLITVRGKELIERADAILFDALISTQLLHWAKDDCQKIYVGKRAGAHSSSQNEINAELVRLARAGLMVVRLKGGDPFVFGRGGEEALACQRAGVDFEFVPGVTSAFAAPATAGIPVLHREVAGSVLVLHGRLRARDESTCSTGDEEAIPAAHEGEAHSSGEPEPPPRGGIVIKKHRKRSAEDTGVLLSEGRDSLAVELSDSTDSAEDTPLSIDWAAACRAADTLVLLMGLGKMEEIREGLLSGGRPPDQAVAVVQWGTMPMQRTVVSTVEDFPKMVRAAGLGSPAVIVVGEVVNLRQHLNVFENRPLFGWRIGFAEGEDSHQDFADALVEAGAQPLLIPCALPGAIATTPEEKQAILAQFRDATHVLLSDAGLADAFFKGLAASGLVAESLLQGKRLLAATQEGVDAFSVFGFEAHLVSGRPKGAAFEEAFGMPVEDGHVVVLEGEDEWAESGDALEEAGAIVSCLPITGARPHEPGIAKLAELLGEGGLEAVFVPNADVVASLRRVWGEEQMLQMLKSIVLVAGDAGALTALESAGVAANIKNAGAEPEKLVRKLINFRSTLGGQRTVFTEGQSEPEATED